MKVEKREIRIHNIVASAAFKHGIDLDAIVKAFPHVEYRPERFLGLPFKLKKPKTCILIFNSGRMVCTGAKSEREARRAIMKVAKELKAAGIIITGKLEVHIVNIVASGNLGAPVDLEELCKRAHTGRLMYEPEQFSGAWAFRSVNRAKLIEPKFRIRLTWKTEQTRLLSSNSRYG